MTKKLVNKLKVVSFISIVLVIFIHSHNINYSEIQDESLILRFNFFTQFLISQGISRIAVPIFFAISGYLFFVNYISLKISYLTKINKRVKSLLLPYITWSLFNLLLFFLLQNILKFDFFLNKKQIFQYTFHDFFHSIFIQPIPYQLWFIRDLFLICLFSPLIFKLLNKFKIIIIIFLFIIWLMNLNLVIIRNESLLFFVFGSYLSIYKIPLQNKIISKYSSFGLILWIILLTIRFFCFDSIIFHRITIIMGILSFWFFYDKLSIKKVLLNTQFYDYTFFIFLVHEPMLSFIKKILLLFFDSNINFYLPIYFIAPLITILLSIIIGVILKKKCLILYSYLTGGR